jgi:hypothetical protein
VEVLASRIAYQNPFEDILCSIAIELNRDIQKPVGSNVVVEVWNICVFVYYRQNRA